jgi:quercetin dioxygenase-like cupin family protein
MSGYEEHSLDALAALAVGALPAAESGAALAHLESCPACRSEYRALASAVGIVAEATELRTALPPARSTRLKERIVRAALAARPAAPAGGGVARVVPLDELIRFSPGIEWAVVPAPGMTLVYWVFNPPECGDVPPERHAFTQAGFVLQGAVTLHSGNGTSTTMRTGDLYAIAPGTTHGASFAERTVLFDVYAPKNAEYEALYRAMRLRSSAPGA